MSDRSPFKVKSPQLLHAAYDDDYDDLQPEPQPEPSEDTQSQPQQRDSEKRNSAGGVGLHYPFITPQPPDGQLFALSVRPRAYSSSHPRLIPPRKQQRILRFSPLTTPKADFDENNGSINGHTNDILSPGQSDIQQTDSDSDSGSGSGSGSDSDSENNRNQSLSTSSASPTLQGFINHSENVEESTRNIQRDAWSQFNSTAAIPPVTLPSSLIDNLLISCNPFPSQLTTKTICQKQQFPPSSNPIAPICIDDKISLVYPSDGTLSSISIISLNPPRPSLLSYPSSPYQHNDLTPVTHIRTVPSIGLDPPMILSATSNSITLSSVSTSTTSEMYNINHHSHLSYNNNTLLDISINSLSYESAVLSTNGIEILGHPDHVSKTFDEDIIHPLHINNMYTCVCYTPHPRILLCSSSKSLANYDLRTPFTSPCLLHKGDYGNVRQLVTNNDYQIAVAGDDVLNYLDIRSPRESLLKLSYERCINVQRIATTRIYHNSHISDILAFSTPADQYLMVTQALWLENHNIDMDIGNSRDIPKQRVVWGDEPVHIGNLYNNYDHIGLAVIPKQNDSKGNVDLDIIQWELNNGISVVTLCVEAEADNQIYGADENAGCEWDDDTSISIEAVIKEQMKKNTGIRNKEIVDNCFNIYHARKKAMLIPTTDSKSENFKCTGMKLLSSTCKIPYELSRRARERICNSSHDDITNSKKRLPRISTRTEKCEKKNDMMGKVRENTGGLLLQEVGSIVRGGGLKETPLVDILDNVLKVSPFIDHERVRWHEGCCKKDRHVKDSGYVATDDVESIPDWVDTDVYYWKSKEEEEEEEESVPRESQVGRLLNRMKNMFFEDDDVDDDGNDGESGE